MISATITETEFYKSQVKLLVGLRNRMEIAYQNEKGMKLTAEEVSMLWLGKFCEVIDEETGVQA